MALSCLGLVDDLKAARVVDLVEEVNATLVTTADHDDRVVPAHSFKFTAQMQHCQAGDAPILIRIESKAGHGAGKPTSKRIDEAADMYAFLFQNIGVPYREIEN